MRTPSPRGVCVLAGGYVNIHVLLPFSYFQFMHVLFVCVCVCVCVCVYPMCAGGQYFRFNPSAYIENKRKQQKDINERFQLVLTTSSLTSILNQVYS